MPHPLEAKYGLTSGDLLDAIERLTVALEGAVAEVHFERKIRVGSQEGWIGEFETHDTDGSHDFTLFARSGSPIRVEVKTIRNGAKPKVEVQKTRNAKDDPSSRLYAADQFDVLAVCIGRFTGNWTEFRYAIADRLPRHRTYPNKLKVMHDVPLEPTEGTAWFSRLQEVIDELV